MTDPRTRMNGHPRSIAVAAMLLSAASTARGQSAFYSNHSADPESPALSPVLTTLSGTAAPSGFTWSEVAHSSATSANAVAGFSTHTAGLSGAYRFADDFTLAGPEFWLLSTASFYAFQTDAPPGASPFIGINVRIWDGVPGEPGSHVVFGDASANRLAASTATNIYRIFNTFVAPALPATTSRLIWRNDANLGGLVLRPGIYWIDWQYELANPLLQAYSPPATIDGIRGPVGANARQFRPEGDGAWTPVVDPGKPAVEPDIAQDMPFILRGGPTCAADFNRDFTVNSQDFFDFLAAFFASDPRADFNADSFVNSQDFFDFLVAFFACV